MTFTNPVASISIDAIASSDFSNEDAILALHDSTGTQLDQLTNPGAGGGVVRTLTLTRTMTDIKYAVVSSSGPFLRLDNLRFETEAVAAVPEPSTFALLGIGGLALAGYGWRRKR